MRSSQVLRYGMALLAMFAASSVFATQLDMTPGVTEISQQVFELHRLMLYICWLIFEGALAQVKINWDSTSAVMETSMGYFYASGMVFALLAAPILLLYLWRLLSGQLSENELIGIRESEEEPITNPRP